MRSTWRPAPGGVLPPGKEQEHGRWLAGTGARGSSPKGIRGSSLWRGFDSVFICWWEDQRGCWRAREKFQKQNHWTRQRDESRVQTWRAGYRLNCALSQVEEKIDYESYVSPVHRHVRIVRIVFSLLTFGKLLSSTEFGQENCSDWGKYSLQTRTECLTRLAVHTQGHTMITHTHTDLSACPADLLSLLYRGSLTLWRQANHGGLIANWWQQVPSGAFALDNQ